VLGKNPPYGILEGAMEMSTPFKGRSAPLSCSAIRNIGRPDVILITGDAYIDHPSFGAALVGRYLESLGLTVGIISMPDVNNPADFTKLGEPRYFFGVTSGNVDSMVSLYTAQKKIRTDDPYVPGNMAGLRPERAVIAYCNAIRRSFKNCAIIIGGVEASLRRIAHYDYWSDTVRRPVLLDAKADLLVYGMAEKPLAEIVKRLKAGIPLSDMCDIPGTVRRIGKSDSGTAPDVGGWCPLPSFEEVSASKRAFSEMTKLFFDNQGAVFIQRCGNTGIVVNPPAPPLSQKEFDAVCELPFAYAPHPSYKEPIPAWEQIKDSFTIVRGCFGGCNFCGLGLHQGKTIQSRSKESVVREVKKRAQGKDWKGVVSDLGGPTANMYGLFCKRHATSQKCNRRSCLVPKPCLHLMSDQSEFADLIRRVGSMHEAKHVYVNSGIRMDLALLWPEIIELLAQTAIGGQMSVAPEHVSPNVLKYMGKPDVCGWDRFKTVFDAASRKAGKKQFLIPYLIAGHPGSTLADAKMLGDFLKKSNIQARQVQEFMPLPMTVSASMYYTGEDPFTGEKVYVSHKLSEMRQQKKLIMWWKTGRT
jgi:uncharacterized radical SAM protein YgiQ